MTASSGTEEELSRLLLPRIIYIIYEIGQYLLTRADGTKIFNAKKVSSNLIKNIETCAKVLYTMRGGQMSTDSTWQKCPRSSDRGRYLKGSMTV